jgi:hypothetical protein
LDRFDTKGSAVFCGSIVSTPEFHEGFVRENQPPNLRLSLELDTDQLTSRPGTITSDDGAEANGLCAAQALPLFNQAELHPISELFHDPLSTLEFGEGRDHNFFAWVDSTCKGTLLALVSLMKNEKVEIRLFKPAATPTPSTAREDKPGFALFHLNYQKHPCF